VVFEFARQSVQPRETNSITETTFAKFARQILAWLNRALRVYESWRTRSIAKVASLTAPLSNPWFAKWKQMRALNDRMSRMLAADEEAAPVDTFFVDPFRRCAHRNGWHH
jgi:hypothetical protein